MQPMVATFRRRGIWLGSKPALRIWLAHDQGRVGVVEHQPVILTSGGSMERNVQLAILVVGQDLDARIEDHIRATRLEELGLVAGPALWHG